MQAIESSATVINITSLKAGCQTCSLRGVCLPLGLGDSDTRALEGIVRSRRRLRKGERLFRMGDPFRALYAIRAGSTKTCEISNDGSIQISAFHLPGELLGIDAISTELHPSDVIALEGTEICELPFDKLEALAREIPELQHQLFRIMSREILEEESQLLMLGRMKAEERLATFLLHFSQRFQQRGYSPTVLRLPMSRQDLGDYLGLALETVSRLLSRFQEDRLLTVQGRSVELLDLHGLREITRQHPQEKAARG